jgi:Mrp family chromosome partitioning ATPase/uncharacterized protein involved in exopolysaccharide biosynthesis
MEQDAMAEQSVVDAEQARFAGSPEGPQPPVLQLHPLRSLGRHIGVALLMVALVGAAAYPVLEHQITHPLYRSESMLLVTPVFARVLTEDRELQVTNFQQFVQQQVVAIPQADVLMNALDRLGVKRSVWQQEGEAPQQAAVRLGTALKVTRVPDTSYITIALEDEKPDGLAEVVNAVAESYLARVKTQPFFGLDVRMESLNRRKTELQEEIKAKKDLLGRWAKDLGVPDFDTAPNQTERLEVDRSLNTARSRRLEAEARLASLIARHDAIRGLNLDPEIHAQLGQDAELTGLRTMLLARKNEKQGKLMGITREHAGRGAIEREIAEIDDELARAEKAASERLRAALAQRRDAQLASERNTAEADVEQAKQYEKTIQGEADKLEQRAARYNKVYMDAQAVRHDMNRARRQLDAIDDRLDQFRMETNAPGFVHLYRQAMPPSQPSSNRVVKWITLFAAAAAGLALGVPMLLDAVARTIRTPHEFESAVRTPLFGWIPERKRRSIGVSQEQVRRLALALDRERRRNRRSCFVFTAVAPKTGTTGLVLSLAMDLKQIGVRAVAVEANALHRDPRFALPDRPDKSGLFEAITGETRADRAVIQASDMLPDRLSWGRADRRSLSARAEAIRSAMNQLGERFEIILLDAPPVLYSSDAELLASVADASFLIVRAEKNTADDIQKALQVLRRSASQAVGVLLNRVRAYRVGSDA